MLFSSLRLFVKPQRKFRARSENEEGRPGSHPSRSSTPNRSGLVLLQIILIHHDVDPLSIPDDAKNDRVAVLSRGFGPRLGMDHRSGMDVFDHIALAHSAAVSNTCGIDPDDEATALRPQASRCLGSEGKRFNS